MARLIDEDEINMSDISPVDGFSVYGATAEDIRLTPTVDAIPRSKIDEMIAEIKGYFDGFGWYEGDISDLSDDFLSIIHKYCDKSGGGRR